MPFFSVIIPTYNRANFLSKTLQSIQSQSFDDFEIILVDDGSTDHTPELIAQTFQHEPRLRYFRKKNEERSIARNFGMEQARGTYFFFFDSDDLMHENHLETLHQIINQNPDYQIFITKYKLLNQEKYEIPLHFDFPEKLYDYSFLLKGNMLASMLCIHHKIRPLHLFHPDFNMCEDWIFNVLNIKNHQVYIIDKWTITMQGHENRSMADNQLAINGRIRAMNYLLKEVDFNLKEQKILQGYSYRFCTIHAYLDGNLRQALDFWSKMVAFLGFRVTYFTFLTKIFVGKKNISYIQRLLSKLS